MFKCMVLWVGVQVYGVVGRCLSVWCGYVLRCIVSWVGQGVQLYGAVNRCSGIRCRG